MKHPERDEELMRRLRRENPSAGELESRVPDDLAEGMWSRVEAALGRRPAPLRRDFSRPLLAAAAVLLLLATGYLLGERGQLLRRQEDLSLRLARLETAAPAPLPAQDALMARYLGRRESWSPAQLTHLLEGLPPGAQILDAASARRLAAQLGSEAPLDPDDGLQADEALALARRLPLDPETAISSRRLERLGRRLSGEPFRF